MIGHSKGEPGRCIRFAKRRTSGCGRLWAVLLKKRESAGESEKNDQVPFEKPETGDKLFNPGDVTCAYWAMSARTQKEGQRWQADGTAGRRGNVRGKYGGDAHCDVQCTDMHRHRAPTQGRAACMKEQAAHSIPRASYDSNLPSRAYP